MKKLAWATTLVLTVATAAPAFACDEGGGDHGGGGRSTAATRSDAAVPIFVCDDDRGGGDHGGGGRTAQ